MDISGHERDMIPMPISSSYAAGFHGGYGHMRVHDSSTPSSHINSTQSPPLLLPSNGSISPDPDDHLTYKKLQVTIRYRECLKNHAAAMGGNATDGCGEFLPSGEEGTLESLKCSVCSCHRNFHRKETDGDHHHLKHSSCGCYSSYNPKARKLVVGQKGVLITPNSEAFGGYPATGSEHMTTRPQQHYPQHHVIMSYNSMGHLPNSESDHDQEEGGGHGTLQQPNRPPDLVIKKRFRTRFTQEQKEKMLSFAERVGWRIQNQEDVVVKQFCQEIGVKRRVLKVWMHNNKHNQLAKKNSSTT